MIGLLSKRGDVATTTPRFAFYAISGIIAFKCLDFIVQVLARLISHPKINRERKPNVYRFPIQFAGFEFR